MKILVVMTEKSASPTGATCCVLRQSINQFGVVTVEKCFR